MNFIKELKLIKWPTRKTLIKNCCAIFITTGIFSGLIAVANLLVSYLLKFIL